MHVPDLFLKLRHWRKVACFFVAMLPLFGSAADSFDPATGILTIPLVVSGNTSYTNVRITIAGYRIGGGIPTSSYDTYNPVTNQLTIPSVTVGTATYNNVVVTVGTVLSIGSANSIQAAPVLALVNPLPNVTVGQNYTTVLMAAIFPNSRYTYSIDTLANGALPGGMTVDVNGNLTGRPTVTGRTDVNGSQVAKTYTFGVCATDTITRVMTTPCSQTSITVNPAPVACVYTYSWWSVCSAGQQIRSVLSATPAGCTGTPASTQACTTTPPIASACYYCRFDISCRVFGFGGCWRCSNSTVVGGNCQAPSDALVFDGRCVQDATQYRVCQ